MQQENILAEIRRTAQENGGKPLGVGRFKQATNIRPYDWGKYWARFGDAVRDAGFEPNTLQTAYDDNYLLEKLTLLARELGKFPTDRERRIKKFSDPTFPSPKTFDRLGNKQQLISKVVTFCSSRVEYADVADLLSSSVDTTANDVLEHSLVTEVENTRHHGFVYLVRGHPGEYKIGRTNLVDRRLSELGATASIEQELVHHIETDDPAGIEAYWHRRFQDKHMRGEWFRLSTTDVKAFQRWRKIY